MQALLKKTTSHCFIDMMQKILSRTGLAAVGDIEVPMRGSIATNFAVDTTEGKFMVRLYPAKYQGSKLETGCIDFEVEALYFLASRGLLVPSPRIFSSTRRPIIEIEGAKIFIYPFIEGKCLKKEELSTQAAFAASSFLKEMIFASSFFIRSSLPSPEGDVEYIQKIALERQKQYPQLKNSFQYQELCEFALKADIARRLNSTPFGIVHGDFFYENILMNESGELAVIDFGDAYYGHVLMDIVIGSMEFCVLSNNSWDMEMFEAFLMPQREWLVKNGIDFALFYDLLLINCLRFAVYTLPTTFAARKLVVDNLYIARFYQLKCDGLKRSLERVYAKSLYI